MIHAQTRTPTNAGIEEGFSPELRAFWRHFPDKGLFLTLLAAWLVLFHVIGNGTFGYVDNASIFGWMAKVYNAEGSEDNFCNFIPLLVLGLLWVKRKELLAQPLNTWWPGILAVAGGLLFHAVGYILQQPRASIVGFFVGLYGLMGLTWGPRFLRATFFPFFLFVFMVPFGSIATPVTFRLQLVVTKIVAFLCHDIFGLSVARNGTQLINSVRHYHYEVAAACGGIRSLISIGLLSVIYGFTVFPATWQRLLLMACAIPLALLGNTIRLLIIVLTAESRGQTAGMAAHDSAIWSTIPYVAAIAGFLLVGYWMETRMTAKSKPDITISEQSASA